MRTLTIIVLLISATLITAGCSRQVSLDGRITFADNGEPDVVGRKDIRLYGRVETSDLTFIVDGKNNTFDIQVERPKKLAKP